MGSANFGDSVLSDIGDGAARGKYGIKNDKYIEKIMPGGEWANAGWREKLAAELQDPAKRAAFERQLEKDLAQHHEDLNRSEYEANLDHANRSDKRQMTAERYVALGGDPANAGSFPTEAAENQRLATLRQNSYSHDQLVTNNEPIETTRRPTSEMSSAELLREARDAGGDLAKKAKALVDRANEVRNDTVFYSDTEKGPMLAALKNELAASISEQRNANVSVEKTEPAPFGSELLLKDAAAMDAKLLASPDPTSRALGAAGAATEHTNLRIKDMAGGLTDIEAARLTALNGLIDPVEKTTTESVKPKSLLGQMGEFIMNPIAKIKEIIGFGEEKTDPATAKGDSAPDVKPHTSNVSLKSDEVQAAEKLSASLGGQAGLDKMNAIFAEHKAEVTAFSKNASNPVSVDPVTLSQFASTTLKDATLAMASKNELGAAV